MNMRQGAGKQRKSVLIRSWMVREGLKPTVLAREIGVSHTLVAQTISGIKNNRRVLRALRDHGCPLKWLALPQDLENGKQEAA